MNAFVLKRYGNAEQELAFAKHVEDYANALMFVRWKNTGLGYVTLEEVIKEFGQEPHEAQRSVGWVTNIKPSGRNVEFDVIQKGRETIIIFHGVEYLLSKKGS